MADFSSGVLSPDQQVARCGTAGKETSSVPTGPAENPGGADRTTVFKKADSHNTDGQKQPVKGGCASIEFYQLERTKPADVERPAVDGSPEDTGEEEGVYVIEYSNAEEEGESYQFTVSVDKSLAARHHAVKHPFTQHAPAASRPHEAETKKPRTEDAASNSSRSLSQSAHANGGAMSSDPRFVCALCPPPERFFRRASALAVHLKHIHTKEEKTFFCARCKKTVRSQTELDTHTRRHARRDAVFTCALCSPESASQTETGRRGFRGSKGGLKRHLEREHPGVVPRCHVCNKNFKSLLTYLADQFRHVGVSPYYCAECKIYELTERGLSVHVRNHRKKSKTAGEAAGNPPPSSSDNSATDDSDF